MCICVYTQRKCCVNFFHFQQLGLVFLHSDGYSVPLRLEEYKRLLGVVLKCGRSRKLEKVAADCIRSVKHVSSSYVVDLVCEIISMCVLV